MSTEQKSTTSTTTNRGRSLSRQILGNDLDLVNKYSAKYSTGTTKKQPTRVKRTNTYTAVPNPYSIYNGHSGYGTGGYGSSFNHGYGSGSGSSNGSIGSSRKPRGTRRQPSNLINTNTFGQWDSNTVTNQQQDMSAAMSAMVDSYQTRIIQEANFLDEIQDEALDNEEFAKTERAEEWSVKEVCFWLNKIHLDKYIKAFRDQIIDGSILLRDLDEAMLVNELGIKRLHVKKLLREITKLKNKSPKFKKEINDTRDELIQSLRDEINQLKKKNRSLTSELQVYKLKSGQSSNSSMYGNYGK